MLNAGITLLFFKKNFFHKILKDIFFQNLFQLIFFI